MTHVLVAATADEDPRPGAFSYTLPGELVVVGIVCDADRRGDDCGCGRSWIGATTRRATTIAKVADLTYDADDYATALISAGIDIGLTEHAAAMAAHWIAEIAAGHDVGTLMTIHANADGERTADPLELADG